MAQYIDKDAVLAMIEQLKDEAIDMEDKARWFLSAALAKRIEAIEVKEVTNIELLKVKGFLVTDKDDYTAIYSTKPNKGRTEWVDGNHPRNANESSCLITLNNARLLPDIEFNDKPIEVEVVIKAQKGK